MKPSRIHRFAMPATSSASVPAALMLLALTVATTCFLDVASGATFRVTTKIFEGSQLDPAAEHVILFDNGLVYDFPQIDTRFVTIFDPAQNQVTLLDRQNRVQTSLRTDDLLKISAAARAAAQTDEQKEQLGIDAKVQPSNRVQGWSVRFGGMEYHVTTQRPADPTVAADFARFADLASRLNIVRRLGPPPFGRMTLNQHIAQQSEIPLETTLTLRRGDEVQEFRSTHLLEMPEKLTEEDQSKIEEARGMTTLYQEVAPKDFQ